MVLRMHLPMQMQTRNCWAAKVFLDNGGTLGRPVTLRNDPRDDDQAKTAWGHLKKEEGLMLISQTKIFPCLSDRWMSMCVTRPGTSCPRLSMYECTPTLTLFPVPGARGISCVFRTYSLLFSELSPCHPHQSPPPQTTSPLFFLTMACAVLR